MKPYRGYIKELETTWGYADPQSKRKYSVEKIDWEKWSHKFNKGIRQEIKTISGLGLPNSTKKLGITGLNFIFSMWQSLNRLHRMPKCKYAYSGKRKREISQYQECKKDAIEHLDQYAYGLE